MNKNLKRFLSSLLAGAMVLSTLTVPVMAEDYVPMVEGDTVLNEWKFDFGSADDVADGYTAVTADRNYVTTQDYGFLGIDEEGYKLGNRLDGFGNQKGQTIQLQAGGGTGLNDAVGSVGEDAYGNAGDKYYPTRFALKVEDEQYFRVKATVTGLDQTKDATVNLYTSRKHPIVKNKTVAAGETYTVEFSVRTTPIYYEKSEPKGTIADGLVNVCVLGENSALAALEIQQVETLPVMWVLGDSTVTDGNTTLPFFDLQNYTGVGTGLTMYLPRTMAMVNEGEGGLNAADNYHFNMVKDRIKAGDYMYVEYGHNHKSDGTTGYVSNLDKYYNACTAVGAKLLIVSPIERINTFSDGAYQQSLNGFADAGEAYVAEKVAAGATDIAYVDLNDFSINFYNKITTDNGGDSSAIKYYFQTGKGGGTDQTHPNDAGAEHLAYEFMKAAQAVTDETQKAVVEGFLTGMTEETPTLVSADIMAGGVGGTAWPQYIVPSDNPYPVVIKDIVVEDGAVTQADVEVQEAVFSMTKYGIIVITVTDGTTGEEKGKIYAVDQVDNSTGYGSQTITNFTNDITIGENDTYSAVVMQALDTEDGLVVDTEDSVQYSATYIPTDIVAHLLTNEDKTGPEDFDFYGGVYEGDAPSTLTAMANNWKGGGSAGQDITLGLDGETKYTNISSDGAKNGAANQGSFYIWKDLDSAIGTTGKYMISADVKYVSGGGMNFKLMKGVSDKVLYGTDGLTAFTVGSNGVVTAGGLEAGTVSAIEFTNVKWILDMDRGTATITVGSGDPVEYEVANYTTTSTTVTPTELTSFQFEINKAACAIQVSSLAVAQLKQAELPEKTVKLAVEDEAYGAVAFLPVTDSGYSMTLSGSQVTVTAVEASEVVVLEAVYNEDNTLASVAPKTVKFDGAGIQIVDVSAGSKVMLWDSIKGLKPLAESIDVSEAALSADVIEKDSCTAPLNTTVTAYAKANEGYVFMGWKDAEGNIVSEDSAYTFRIRDDATLIANFVVEPTLADVATFDISSDPASIKSTAGTTATMKVENAADAAGTPFDKITNADLAWTCDTAGITVDANGVVTVGDDFELEVGTTKDVVISATLNGITKTYTMTVYAYEYFENMTSGATNFDGTFMTIGTKEAIVFPGANTTQKYRMSEAVTLDKNTTIKYSNAWTGANTCGQTRTLNFVDSNGTVLFSMYYSWASLFVGGTELTSAVAKDTWSDVEISIDTTAMTVTVTAGGNSATTTLAAATDIAGIDFVSAGSVPGPEVRALGMSSIIIAK